MQGFQLRLQPEYTRIWLAVLVVYIPFLLSSVCLGEENEFLDKLDLSEDEKELLEWVGNGPSEELESDLDPQAHTIILPQPKGGKPHVPGLFAKATEIYRTHAWLETLEEGESDEEAPVTFPKISLKTSPTEKMIENILENEKGFQKKILEQKKASVIEEKIFRALASDPN